MLSSLETSERTSDSSYKRFSADDRNVNAGTFSRLKKLSVTTSYYESSEDKTLDNIIPLEPSQQKTKQSPRLPPWVWFLLAKSLGIPLHPTDRPILGTLLHLFTFTSALVYVLTEAWYCIYNIISPNTKQDILKGSVAIVLTVMWVSIGMYAKSLNRRLFRHPRFLSDVRMHSRTVFKINAALLVFLLGLIFVSINDFQAVDMMKDETCINVELTVVVCKLNFVARVIFSVFSLLWNTLVAIVLMSVCRTHTIGIRRFIRELEHDALTYDHHHCELYHGHPMTKEDVCEETFWLEEETSVDDGDHNEFIVVHHNVGLHSLDRQQTISQSIQDRNVMINPVKKNEEIIISCSPFSTLISNDGEIPSSCAKNEQVPSQFIPVNVVNGNEELTAAEASDNTMSTAEILHKHWKISCRLRMSSCALQRWIASILALVIIWCFVFLIRWQDHPPGMDDILQFVVPLLLLPLLCSAYAEVNMEGVRMIKCVCPIEDRLAVIRFLSQNPLQMTIFGYGMSYGTIMTVFFAIFVAFTSRLIFSEIQQNSS